METSNSRPMFSWHEFRTCLPVRANARHTVHWEVSSKTLVFATPFPEAPAGFERIERGRITDSVRALAQHDHVNVLQRIMADATGSAIA